MSSTSLNPRERIAHLSRRLMERGWLTIAWARELTGASDRALRQDLDILRAEYGLEVSGGGRAARWILPPEAQLRGRAYVDRVATWIGRRQMGFLDRTPLAHPDERDTSEWRIPPKQRRNWDRKFRVLDEPARGYAEHDDHIATVLEGVILERRIHMRRRRSNGEIVDVVLEPLTLQVYRRALYLVARDVERPPSEQIRTYALDRVVEVTEGEAFDYPGPQEWDPDDFQRRWFGIVKDGPVERVILVFSAEKADLVRSRTWHPGQRITDLDDGRVELRFTAGGAELERWVLEWGQHVVVIKPDWLRERVVSALRAALDNYPDR